MSLPFDWGVLRAASPGWLLALLALPIFLAGTGRWWRTRLAAGCRAAAAALLVLVLAGVYVERPRSAAGTCVVAAVDVSASVEHAARDAARDFLAEVVPALGGEDQAGVVAFAGQARVVAHPAAGRPSLETLLPPGDLADLAAGDTDLGAALLRARPLCPEGKQAALVLFTDGNETVGSAMAEVALADPPVPVFPVVPPAPALAPARVRRLVAPALVPAGAAVPLEAVVDAREPLSAALELSAGGEAPPPLPLDLPAGLSVVRLPYRFGGAGHYLLQARLLLPPGQPPSGPVAAPVTVSGPLRVLVVSERAAPVVAAALAERGMEVERVTPGDFRHRVARLGEHHLVVLDDVARAGFRPADLDALARHVAAGGALVVTGGPHLFADPGFVGTALERVLPVALQSQAPEPREREPIGLYLLIDRSNSMGYATSEPALGYGEKMEYAKRAALAVLDQLGPNDLVGAVAFDSQPYELGPLRPAATGRAALAAKIRALRYGGGTDFKEALDIAYRNLLRSGRRVRHVILLTDGDTNRHTDDHMELVGALAQAEISVTSIRIGSDALNLRLLETIARATGGEFHHVENARALPELMIDDARRLLRNARGEEATAVRVARPGPILTGLAEDDLPPVDRWAITRPKAEAELRLFIESDGRRDPILATWQYELGRVAALPLDFQGGAAAWSAWPGFGKLWAQLVGWAAPAALASARHLTAEHGRDGTWVRLETAGDEPGPFVLRVPGLVDVLLPRTGPRRFAALVPALGPGRQQAVLVTGAAEEPVELVVAESATSGREYRRLSPDLTLLEQLAARTGGRVAPRPRDVLAARAGVAREVRPLAGLLVPLVLALVLADVALRPRAA